MPNYDLPWLLHARAFVTKLQTCWIQCNTKNLTHQGCNEWLARADSAGPVYSMQILYLYKCTLNEINDN